LNRLPKLTPSDVDVVCTAESDGILKEQMADLSLQVNELKQVIVEVANPTVHAKSSTMQPKVSIAAVDDFNLGDDSSADLLLTSMNKEQWFVQSKKKKTQLMAVRKLVCKGNKVSTSIKAITKESPKSWHIFVGRLHPETTAEDLTTHLSDRGISVSECNQLARTESWQEKFSSGYWIRI